MELGFSSRCRLQGGNKKAGHKSRLLQTVQVRFWNGGFSPILQLRVYNSQHPDLSDSRRGQK
jgi:hypothetical protein